MEKFCIEKKKIYRSNEKEFAVEKELLLALMVSKLILKISW